MHYRQYGVVVPTPYGYGKVLLYRPEDQVLMCELGFGGPPRARLYLPLSVPMNIERGKEDAERIAMERDEEACRAFYGWEKANRRDEYEKMAYEERTLRALFKRIDDAAAEDAEIARAIAAGVRDAEEFLETPAGSATIADRCAAIVSDEEAERNRAIEAWKLKPVGPIPKPLTKKEKREL